MRYTKFTIQNYRAIAGPLEINIANRSLMPIIGINESGKTTILHAIFAFDSANDALNEDGRHLKDTINLYKTNPPPATVQAEIELSREELLVALEMLVETEDEAKSWAKGVRRKQFPDRILITRHIPSRDYTIDTPGLNHPTFGALLAAEIIGIAPYILFFDDFRDKIDENIEIKSDDGVGRVSGWLAIIERLFNRTDPQLSVFQLSGMEERQRKSVLAKVQRPPKR